VDLYKMSAQKLASQATKDPAVLDKVFAMLSHLYQETGDLNAFNFFDLENIKKQIALIKNKIAEGKQLPLAGVPISLGDNICTENIKTTCSSKMLANYEPPFDSIVNKIIEESGAIMAGKTNLEEFGLGCNGSSSYYGIAKNPWDNKRVAGSGAAAAVATLISTLSLATDTAGELRQSAAYCGVMALKPSYGRISRRGIIEYASSMEQLGAIARRTEDLAVALELISGPDQQDSTSLNKESPSYISSLNKARENFKIAVPDNWDQAPGLEDEVEECFREQLENLNTEIFQVEYVSLRYFQKACLAASIINAAEAFSNLANYDGVRFGFRYEGKSLQDMYFKSRSEGFSSKMRQYLTLGALVSSGKYYEDYFLKSQRLRTLIKKELEECLEHYELLLTPTSPFTAPFPSAEPDTGQLPDVASFYTAAANLAGLPALSFPLYTFSKRPAGLQFIGKFDEETTLLKVSSVLEEEGISLKFTKPGSME